MFDSTLLNRLCIFQRKTLTEDGRGGATAAWANLYTDIKCRLYVQSGQEKTIYGREANEIFRNLMIPYSSARTITEQDRVVVDDETWDIESIDKVDASAVSHHHKLVIRRVK